MNFELKVEVEDFKLSPFLRVVVIGIFFLSMDPPIGQSILIEFQYNKNKLDYKIMFRISGNPILVT